MWVDARKAEGFEVKAACQAQRSLPRRTTTSRSERHRVPPKQEWDEAILINEMRKVHDDLDDSCSFPRMKDQLADRRWCGNHKRVERLMAANGLHAKDGRRTKDPHDDP